MNNQFEKNVFWCCFCYLCENALDFTKQKRVLNDKIHKITFQIPCQIIQKPKCAFVRIYGLKEAAKTGIVAIPYFNDQPILAKHTQVRRIGQFDFEMTFDSAEMARMLRCCLEKMAQGV